MGCEFSAEMRDAFAGYGWDAWSCDLLPSEQGGQHIQGDVCEAVKRGWDLIILHPPCTAIALCGNRWYGRGMPKHHERIAALEWTAALWHLAKEHAPQVALENPKNTLGAVIGKRSCVVHPWQHGHLEQKETWLWLHKLPPVIPSKDVYAEMMELPKNQRERIFYMSPGDQRGHERSRTFMGIAKAIAEQWS